MPIGVDEIYANVALLVLDLFIESKQLAPFLAIRLNYDAALCVDFFLRLIPACRNDSETSTLPFASEITEAPYEHFTVQCARSLGSARGVHRKFSL
jgi:hypothetical protein